ncbi:hypothetical protein BLNAU_12471 [Blattamonas nauphoetae]|uniref:Uncharacterized protein n=1 Tax=Blattamonas nauphoetae TaxID=2049346 RepID=A0ABQ9XJN2_9EUKA|nr:hypothetical protein BLNAU_12471 [Blattamonas nauphoetae]
MTGGGVMNKGMIDLLVVDSKFERCGFATGSTSTFGGGVSVYFETNLTVEMTHFIECSSVQVGSAISLVHQIKLTISDTLVKNCTAGTTGAVFMNQYKGSMCFSFTRVFFDGNSVGEDRKTFSIDLGFGEKTTKFTDVAILCVGYNPLPTLTFIDCYTTTSPDSSGIIVGRTTLPSSSLYNPKRYFDKEFEKIGPLLETSPTARVNEETGKIELEMKGKTPLRSQEYEVIVKENLTGTETELRMMFSDGTGTLVSESEDKLKIDTDYTIISIVGVVPSSPSSRMTNDITIPVAEWAFNLAATPDFLKFTTKQETTIITPEVPSFSTLQGATARLVESDPQSAFVILHFDKEVRGSYEFIVLEEGKPVTLTINDEISSEYVGTKEFKVIGDGKLLTHDTTYTIESIVPTPETDSMFVMMHDTITFHIPKSLYVPPEDPEEPKTEPEDPTDPEDPTEPEPEDPKKSMSPQMKAMLSWLIPLVACLLIAVILLVIVVILLRRRQQKKSEPAQKEMEVQEPLDVEKVEELGVDCSNGVIHTDGHEHSKFNSSSTLQTDMNRSRDGLELQTKKEWVEVMACSGGFEVSLVEDYTTLYSVLHKEKRDIAKRAVGMQLVNGLKAVLANRQASDVVTRLSSHWILVASTGNLQLKLQMSSTEAEQEPAQTKRQDGGLEGNGTLPNRPKDVEQAGMDGLRWRAPEVVAGGGSAVDG